MFTPPLPALPGSPPGFSLGSYFHHVLGLLQTPPTFGFPDWLSGSPHLGTIPHHYSLPRKRNLTHLSLGSLPSARLRKILGVKSAPTHLSKAPGAFCPSPAPSTTGQRNWTSSRSFPFIRCSYHGPAHGQASFALPLPFPCRIDLFSFNSLIFSFPQSGAVSSDPWWEAFCLGLNQDGLGREAGGGKKKKKEGRRTYLLAKPRAALTQHPSQYIIYSATETLIPPLLFHRALGLSLRWNKFQRGRLPSYLSSTPAPNI